MPRRLDPPGTRSRTMGQENGKKVDKSQESWATPTDGEWLLAGPLPPPSKLGRPRSTDLREVPDAIQYMLATGCRLRAIPRCSAPFATVQNHFHPWRDKGVLERMMDALRGLARERAGRDPEPTAAGTGSPSPACTGSRRGPRGDPWTGAYPASTAAQEAARPEAIPRRSDRFHIAPHCACTSSGWSRSRPWYPPCPVAVRHGDTTSGGGHPHFRV